MLGHSWIPDRSLNDRSDIADIDTRLMEANSIIDSYFSKTFKPSIELINANAAFFKSLAGVTDVYILGHSMSSVDELYYQAIIAIPSLAKTRWHIVCRPEDDVNMKRRRLSDLGIAEERVFICSWSDLS